MISKKTVLGVYSDSTLNNLELSLIQTDGVDLYETPVSLLRPYPSDLKNDIYNLMLKGDFSDVNQLNSLSDRLTHFHIEVIAEFIETLEVSEAVKEELRVITPWTYTGF